MGNCITNDAFGRVVELEAENPVNKMEFSEMPLNQVIKSAIK